MDVFCCIVEIFLHSTVYCRHVWKKSTVFYVVYLKKNIKFAKSNVIISKLNVCIK